MINKSSTKRELQVLSLIIIASILVSSIDILGITAGMIFFSSIGFAIFTTIYFSRTNFMKGAGLGEFIFFLHWIYIIFGVALQKAFHSELDGVGFAFFMLMPFMFIVIIIIAGITHFIYKRRTIYK